MSIGIYPPEINQLLDGEQALFAERMNHFFPMLAPYFVGGIGVVIFLMVSGQLGRIQLLSFSMIHMALIVALLFVGIGIYMHKKKGAWIVCTPTRIIHFTKNKHKSTPWEQVTTNITRYGGAKNPSAIIELTTGKTYFIKHGGGRKGFEADKLLINGMKNMDQLEKIIRSNINK